jgi:hypothetical protein
MAKGKRNPPRRSNLKVFEDTANALFMLRTGLKPTIEFKGRLEELQRFFDDSLTPDEKKEKKVKR